MNSVARAVLAFRMYNRDIVVVAARCGSRDLHLAQPDSRTVKTRTVAAEANTSVTF